MDGDEAGVVDVGEGGRILSVAAGQVVRDVVAGIVPRNEAAGGIDALRLSGRSSSFLKFLYDALAFYDRVPYMLTRIRRC